MPRFPLSAEDLTHIRFSVSEMWETVLSLRALQRGQRASHHQPWLAIMREKLDPDLVRPLLAVVPPSGYLPDCLTPMVRDDESFGEALQLFRETPAFEWDDELSRLGDGAGRPENRTLVDLRSSLTGAAGRDRVAGLLERYHAVAIAPYWRRLRGLALADIDHRMDQMATGGVRAVFAELHPKVSLTAEGVDVAGYCISRPSTGAGLLLVPCAFAWPDVLSLTADQYIATVSYAPRGIGNLWTVPSSSPMGAIEKLLGTTRARILRQLDIPVTTSQVAAAMEVSSSTANEHLKVLAGTGLVTGSRHGREVLYRRTRTGDSLLTPR